MSNLFNYRVKLQTYSKENNKMSSKIIELKVKGMTCNGCASNINRFLEKKGFDNVSVNFSTGDVRFEDDQTNITLEDVKAGIINLGFQVVSDNEESSTPFWTLQRKLIISAIFTFPLLLHHLTMSVGWNILAPLNNPWVQLVITIPVYLIGFFHFGKSSWAAIRNGNTHMDVLIFIGSTAAFIYSILGTIWGEMDYIFYETAAMIITLVLLGNWLEHRSVQQTTTAIGELGNLQVPKANKIMASGAIVNIEKGEIEIGDYLQVNEGDKIPTDGKIMSGAALIDESMLTGESIPVEKKQGDKVFGGSIIVDGNVRMNATHIGKNTLLSQMIELVKSAQQDKPEIQRLADKISSIFVPVVLIISLLTFVLSFFIFDVIFQKALMNSIAVLVISCPCAMGLATPTAVMVGVGRMAKNGILVKGGSTLEIFSKIENFVFDKTGTLTTGDFKIKNIDFVDKKLTEEEQGEFNTIALNLEQHSSHPLAKSLVRELSSKRFPVADLSEMLVQIEEQKGQGVQAMTANGDLYKIGKATFATPNNVSSDSGILLSKNGKLIATFYLTDEVKNNATELIQYLKKEGKNPILLSGDKNENVEKVAQEIGISEYYGEQLPKDKLTRIENLANQAPTAMVGDGINDAPALAKATIGVSLSGASQAAIQSAQVVLLNGNLSHLQKALGISQQTVRTIKQNLFWAFSYNIVAIPLAALGFLNPMWGALFMAFSDVVVIGNSIRLKTKRV